MFPFADVKPPPSWWRWRRAGPHSEAARPPITLWRILTPSFPFSFRVEWFYENPFGDNPPRPHSTTPPLSLRKGERPHTFNPCRSRALTFFFAMLRSPLSKRTPPRHPFAASSQRRGKNLHQVQMLWFTDDSPWLFRCVQSDLPPLLI